MSEPEQEQTEQAVPVGVDPVTGEVTDPEPDDDEAAQPEPGEVDEAQQEEAQPARPDAAEQEAIYHTLDRKADNYFKGVAKILEGTGIPLVPCELCADAYPGVRWQPPQNDQAKTMLAVIGAEGSESPLENDPDAQLCERCNGFGWTKLPSHVPGNTERLCRRCNGAGWLDTNPQSGAPVAPVPEATNGPTEPMPGVPEDDPSVVDLRARGYTIIPPMKIEAAGT